MADAAPSWPTLRPHDRRCALMATQSCLFSKAAGAGGHPGGDPLVDGVFLRGMMPGNHRFSWVIIHGAKPGRNHRFSWVTIHGAKPPFPGRPSS